MEIPRGHAMLPLNEADFLDFVFNYFKAEYAPIRSFWSTATAIPRNSERWHTMGHELSPLSFRPARAQAQKDLDFLDYIIKYKNLDVNFVRGMVIRYGKYEGHERLERKLYENFRLDLMVKKALLEKHLIDALWPSPAPRNIHPELLQQGVKVRQWYGDMFAKYFMYLHSVDDFKTRPEVDARIKSSGTLMLVPFVDHLVFGNVHPIRPIVAKGAGFSNMAAFKQKEKAINVAPAFGEPDRFEIRFDAPADIVDTHTRSVVRQCQCNKCGTKRDVKVVISIDPNPGPTSQSRKSATKSTASNLPPPRRDSSRAAQRYSPGYSMPGANDPTLPRAPVPPSNTQDLALADRPASPPQKKQCPQCTFLNHPDLTVCEMCSGELPATLVTKPPSPGISPSGASEPHTNTLPPPAIAANTSSASNRPTPRPVPNRHSLSSTLFSIFPFNQQPGQEHHQGQGQSSNPPISHPEMSEASPSTSTPHPKPKPAPRAKRPQQEERPRTSTPPLREPTPPPQPKPSTPPPNLIDPSPSDSRPSTPPFNQPLTPAMMPLTPPPQTRQAFPGMPQNLMDDFVPVSPAYPQDEDEEDAGWGEMSREEARRDDSGIDSEDDDEDGGKEGMIDLDEVAREEMGAWGDRDSDDEDEDEDKDKDGDEPGRSPQRHS